jgi:hypothetical protein
MLKHARIWQAHPGENIKKKNKCIFTIIRNEPVLLKIWLKNHKKLFDNIYVLFHQSASNLERSLCEQYGATYFNIHNGESYCWIWLTDTANKFTTFLLNSYELVAYADVDEIIVDPKNLLQHPKLFPDVTRCVSLNAVHDYKNEPVALDFNKPLSIQRPKHIWPDKHMSKPIIKRSRLWSHELECPQCGSHAIHPHWDTGCHTLREERGINLHAFDIDKLPHINMDLFLVHLHFMDIKFMLDRHRQRGQFDKISKYERQHGLGMQSWIEHKNQVHAFFDNFEHGFTDRPAWAAEIINGVDITPHD